MTKTSEIIARSLRKLGVLAVDEPSTGNQFTAALDALNAMIHGWELKGVDLSHTDLTGTEDFPLAAKYHEGVVYNLASRLSPDYVVPPAFDADAWFRAIQANNTTIADVTMPAALRIMPSQNQHSLSDDA